MTITAQNFKKFLNEHNITVNEPTAIVVSKATSDHRSSITITNSSDVVEEITIEFSLRFEHHEFQEETIFQRDFAIEHHPEDKSRHAKPHLQIKIHGSQSHNKVGQLWLTLELEYDEEYERCIKGFICVLENIADICKEDLDKELLNLEEVKKIRPEEDFLLEKAKTSLEKNGIEYKDADGNKLIVTSENIAEIIQKDPTLKPLLTFK